MCACNSTFHRAVEVCLNCASAAACAARRKGKHACVALKGVTAVYGGVSSFNLVIQLMSLLQKPGGTDHLF